MGQVGEASKSSTSTSKALKKFAEKAHEVAASKADEEDGEDDKFEDASTDIDDPDKVPKVRYPKSPPTLDTTSLGPGHQDWLSKNLLAMDPVQLSRRPPPRRLGLLSRGQERKVPHPARYEGTARHCIGRPDGLDQGSGSTTRQGCTEEGLRRRDDQPVLR